MRWTWPWARPRTTTHALPTVSLSASERKEAQGFVALHLAGEARWTRRDYASLARAGFMLNPVVHRAVRLVAEAAASLPLMAYEDGTEVATHPALALLARPNPRQAGAAFLEALYGHLLMAGNAYVERIGTAQGARELHLLRPDRVAVACDADGWPVALEHRVGAAKRRIALGADGEALHLSLFHPLDDQYGFAPLEAALAALDTHNAAARWNKALLDNSARPSGALVYAAREGAQMTEEQFDRLKSELEQGYTGSAGAGRPLLLEGGLDWKAMGLTPKDMDFMEARNGAARDIALAIGVPPMLLGIPGDATYANYAEANRAFYRLTVLPLAARTLGSLSAFLDGSGRLRLWYDADGVEGLALEREALWRRVNAAGFLTDDEKREAVGYGRGVGAEEKAGFRPDQPRVPRGRADGGRWTDGAVVVPVQSRPPRSGGGRVRVGSRFRSVQPVEETLIDVTHSQMRAAISRVREVDPNWKPTPQVFESPRGMIDANIFNRNEALRRMMELGIESRPAFRGIEIGPGPFAAESQIARGPRRNWRAEEVRENDRIGHLFGCHTCGTRIPGTPSGHFFLDHQFPNALNPHGWGQRIFPQCASCSYRQGGSISAIRRRK